MRKKNLLPNFKINQMENLNNVQKYIERVKAEQRKADEQKARFIMNEHQQNEINRQTRPEVSGKAAQYKKQLATCKFKLAVYFNADKAGRFYTQIEKDTNKNRQYIPSFDYYNEGVRPIIRHDVAHSQLIDYCLQKADRIQSATMYLIDYIDETESTIFVFNPKNIALSQYVNPIFKTHKSGGVFVDGLETAPLRVDKLRTYYL